MAEETNKDAAASADDLLNEAAAGAVEGQEQETVEEEVVEEVQAAPEKEAEELPEDHQERSKLGRTLSAVHRRQDEFDSKIERLVALAEAQAQANKPEVVDPLDAMEDNEPLTAGEMRNILNTREEAQQRKTEAQTTAQTQAQQGYDKSYIESFQDLTTDLPEDEYNGILEEMKTLRYDPSVDPSKDAELNFYKAERAYLRKKMAKPVEKTIPLRGDRAPGVVTNNKVTTKETALPKLDAAGESYLSYVRANDGAERAEKLHRSAGKE